MKASTPKTALPPSTQLPRAVSRRSLKQLPVSTKTNILRPLLLCLAASSAAAQIAPISVVALSGQQAPGLPIGVTFSALDFAFGFGRMNNAGHVAFLAFVEGPGITPDNDRGMWVGLPGALSLAAREGNQVPDLPVGVVYGTLNETPSLSGNGAVAFRAGLAGTGVTSDNDDALFGGPAGAVRLAARQGDLAPGPPGTTYGGFTGSPINSFHQLAFGGTTGAGVETIWFGAPGSISRAVSVGDPADGFPPVPVVLYSDLILGGVLPPVVLNSAGQIAYLGIAGAGINVIWGGLPLSPHILAREGDPAPGGHTFTGFGAPVITDSGLAAFRAGLFVTPAMPNPPDLGIYRIIIGSGRQSGEGRRGGRRGPRGGRRRLQPRQRTG